MNQISINNNDFFYKQQTYNFKNNIDRLNNNANNNLHQKKFRILEDSEIILNNEKKEIQLKLNHNNYDYIKKIHIPNNMKKLFDDIFMSVGGKRINVISLNELALQSDYDIYLHLVTKKSNIKKMMNNNIDVTYNIINNKSKYRYEYCHNYLCE